MSSSSSARSPDALPIASSSRTPPTASPSHDYTPDDDDDDNLDLDSHELLNEDPLRQSGNGALNGAVSFKRNAPSAKPSLAARFLSSPFGGSRNPTPSPGRGSLNLNLTNGSAPEGLDAKGAESLDWYVEGPGRRVGYDNLTAIDWIYEYSKERTRQQHLVANAPGLVGQLKLLADASQVWIILVATGVAVGGIAAGIDVVSDWLGDMKLGVCVNDAAKGGGGGKFYLNKAFCCWGEESLEECKDWKAWGALLGVGNRGGSYVVEYIFFVLFAVGAALVLLFSSPFADMSGRSSSQPPPPSSSSTTPPTPNNPASPRSKPS